MVIQIRYHFKWEKILFVALMLGLTARVIAQPLPELIDSALLRQPELMALEKEYQAALERAPQVSQLPNPEVGVGGFPLPVETRLGPQLLRLGRYAGLSLAGHPATAGCRRRYQSQSPVRTDRRPRPGAALRAGTSLPAALRNPATPTCSGATCPYSNL